MKSIIIGTLCITLFTSSYIYSLTRADTLLANSLKKQVETLTKTKPAGWKDKAEKLVNELENSFVPKGYDSQAVSVLKKEINPPAVVEVQPIKPEIVSDVVKVDREPTIKKIEEQQLVSQPKIDKAAIIKNLDKQLAASGIDAQWNQIVDDLLFDLSMVDRAMASEYSQKVRGKIVSATAKTSKSKVKTSEPTLKSTGKLSSQQSKLIKHTEGGTIKIEPTLTLVAKVSSQQKKPIKHAEGGTISVVDKEAILKKLDEQLALPVSSEWNKVMDDLLFDLAMVDRTMASEYAQKVREKIVSITAKVIEPIKEVEPIIEKPAVIKKGDSPVVTKQPELPKESPIKEKVEDKTEVPVPVSGEPMIKSTRPGPGSGRRPVAIKKEEPFVSSQVPVKKEEIATGQPKVSQKNLAAIEDELKQLIQEPADQRAADWLQNVNDLIFELSVFDAKKAGMYLEEIYALKTSKPTKIATAVVAQKEPERPKTFGTKAPFFGSVKNLADNKIIETFNKYLAALPDSWVKGKDGGNPAQWWSNDIKVFEKAIKEKKIEIRTPEEIEKEFAARTTKESMAKEIQQEKDKAIAALRITIEKEANEARQGKSPVEKSEITKTFNKKRDEEIAKIKTSLINEDKIKEKIKAAVKVFSPESATQKIEAKVARVRAENQAEEKGFTLAEIEGLSDELAEEIRGKNPSLNEKQIQQLVDKELPQAKKTLLEDKQRELQELSKQLFEEIKKENTSLSDREVQTLVKQKLPQAKKDLDAKKELELAALIKQLTEEVKKSSGSLSEEAIAQLVKEKLRQIKKSERAKKEQQRAKESAARELEELVQDIEKMFAEPKSDAPWIIGVRGKIKELNKLDAKKAKAYQAQFLELAPGEKPFL